jgi:hypothetical protein
MYRLILKQRFARHRLDEPEYPQRAVGDRRIGQVLRDESVPETQRFNRTQAVNRARELGLGQGLNRL